MKRDNTIKTENLETQLGKDFNRFIKFTQMKPEPNATIGNYNNVMLKVGNIHDRSKDITRPYEKISVENKDGIFYICTRDNEYNAFSKVGLESMCTSIDVSAGYIRKCLAADKIDLAAQNVNTWLKEKDNGGSAFLRFTDDRLHGFLTTRYSCFDDIEVMSSLKPVVGPTNEYDIVGSVVEPDLMKLRFVSRNTFEVGSGDKLSYGFDISNSRTGQSSLKVTFLIYRHICGNGMLFNGGKAVYYMQRHVGIGKKDFVSDFEGFMKNIPELTRDIKTQLEKACITKVTNADVQNMIDQFKAKKVSKAAEEKLEFAANQTPISVVWDFTNIITKLAQDYDIAVRERMEVAASQIMQRMIK